MVDVKQLMEYNQEVRHSYFDAFKKIPWDEFVKNREASFHSLRSIFVHILGVIDYWLDFLRKQDVHSRQKFDEYKTFEDVQAYMDHVEERLRGYFNSMPAEGLNRKYSVTNDANETVEITAEDVLIHVFEEEVHHRGELIALLWQMGIEPPLMGWKRL